MSTAKGPVLFDLDDTNGTPSTRQSPADAPPVPDPGAPDAHDPALRGHAMTQMAGLAARPVSRLARWFWSLLFVLLGTAASVTAWTALTRLIEQTPALGWAVTAVTALFLGVVLLIAVKELSALARLGRIDQLQRAAKAAVAHDDLTAAGKVTDNLTALYARRDDTSWGRNRLQERSPEIFDAADLLALADHELLGPLDRAARREIEHAARQVATVTALVPLALLDVLTALATNLRMIRRIAEIYGGRSGTLGSWRLTRAVLTHLIATGAVAVGDDLLEPILGGSLLGKLSRRFGEGLVNGALTARVGVAAMDICRPLPFAPGKRPPVRSIIKSALTGLITRTPR